MRLPGPGEEVEGKYRLDRLVAEGSSSFIYAATTVNTGRPVAVKLLKPGPAGYDVSGASRFLREVRAIGSLAHPNTLTVYDFGRTADGVLFMVTELVDGVDLASELARGRQFNEAECANVLVQVLASLDEAHRKGLLHRDVCPSNIRLFSFGGNTLSVKLLDFGLAKSIAGDAVSLTATGSQIGTPRYLPPEAIAGWNLTPASDLYSVGLIAYEMLFGLNSRTAQDPAAGRVPHIPEGVPVSPVIRAAVNRLLAPALPDRFKSAAEAIAALSQTGLPGVAPPPASTVISASQPPGAPAAITDYRPYIAAIVAIVGVLAYAGWRVVNKPTRRVMLVENTLIKQDTGVSEAPSPDAGAPTATDGGPMAEETQTGCSKVPKFEGRGRTRSLHGLSGDSWLTYLPKGYVATDPHPMLLLLGETYKEEDLLGSGFEDLADEHQIVVAVPRHHYRASGTQYKPIENQIERLDNLVRQMDEEYCLDRSKIFVLGHGDSATLAEILRCQVWVSAAAGASYETKAAAPPEHACKDRQVPFIALSNGGSSAAAVERRWRRTNRCADLPPREAFRHGSSQCLVYSCKTPFESCHVDKGYMVEFVEAQRRGAHNDARKPKSPPKGRIFPTATHVWSFFERATNRE